MPSDQLRELEPMQGWHGFSGGPDFRGPIFRGPGWHAPKPPKGSDAAGQPSREVAQLAQGLQLNLTHTLP